MPTETIFSRDIEIEALFSAEALARLRPDQDDASTMTDAVDAHLRRLYGGDGQPGKVHDRRGRALGPRTV